MAAWMLDPVVCVGMTLGAPQVDLLALSDMKRLVTAAAAPTSSQRDNGIAWEKVDEHDAPAPTSGRQMSLIFEPSRVDGMSDAERSGRKSF